MKKSSDIKKPSEGKSPWAWVPSLYFAEGIPYVVVMTVAVIMYKRLGISNTDIAIYTSWLYLPWVIKPLWSPIVDLFKTKRWWIVIMQLLIGAGLAAIGLTIPAPDFFRYTLIVFWLIAFSSATHDIAADGFYMLALEEHKQAYFIGIRSTFYRGAMITGQGLLIIVAGFFESYTGLEPVRFTVNAVESVQVAEFVPIVPNTKEQAFVLPQQTYDVSYTSIDKKTVDSIKNQVTQSNLANGFVLPEKPIDPKEPGWWEKNVSTPLKIWLKDKFGQAETELNDGDIQGNLISIPISLSQAPEENHAVILNISQRGGDNSIKIISADRLEFTSQNWNKQALVLVQLDPKIKNATSSSFEGRSGNIPMAWSITFFILAGMFLCFCVYHHFFLPRPASDTSTMSDGNNAFKEFFATFTSYFKKENIIPALLFILLYRLGEAQLVKIASPFLLDSRAVGGMGLTTGDVGLVYGTFGVLSLTLGGILGGILASRNGLKYWMLWMALALNITTLSYVYMSFVQPESLINVAICVSFEQFGYGFGFTAYMLYLIYFCEGKHKTAHYALSTGFMALGMMIPGMFSGWVQEIIGYKSFFIWVIICAIPALLTLRFLKIDPKFGKKAQTQE